MITFYSLDIQKRPEGLGVYKKGFELSFFYNNSKPLFYVKHLQNGGNFERTWIFIKRKFHRFDNGNTCRRNYAVKFLRVKIKIFNIEFDCLFADMLFVFFQNNNICIIFEFVRIYAIKTEPNILNIF